MFISRPVSFVLRCRLIGKMAWRITLRGTGIATGMLLMAMNIYISGYNINGGLTTAAYWKNDVRVDFLNGLISGRLNAISVKNGNVVAWETPHSISTGQMASIGTIAPLPRRLSGPTTMDHSHVLNQIGE